MFVTDTDHNSLGNQLFAFIALFQEQTQFTQTNNKLVGLFLRIIVCLLMMTQSIISKHPELHCVNSKTTAYKEGKTVADADAIDSRSVLPPDVIGCHAVGFICMSLISASTISFTSSYG